MIYLSGCVRPELVARSQVGFMLTPLMGNRPDLSATPWAADTGCFSQGASFRLGRYVTWLEETMIAYRLTCRFATAPDVVGDAIATWDRSRHVLPILRQLGYPAALVAQDGIERMLGEIDPDAFDVLFLGGTTRWKLSAAARTVVRWALAHDIAAHMGRVNSGQRLRYAAEIGCATADGTFVAFGPDKNIPRMLEWLAALERQPSLWAMSA